MCLLLSVRPWLVILTRTLLLYLDHCHHQCVKYVALFDRLQHCYDCKCNYSPVNLGRHSNERAFMGEQESQLSQRDRATLRAIEYFAKSLKVIRNDTVA